LGVIFVRSIVLFPAIAVGASDDSWDGAMKMTDGRFWLIVGITFFATLPLSLGLMFVNFLLGLTGMDATTIAILSLVVQSVSRFFEVVVLVAVASRLFQRLPHADPVVDD